MSNASLVRRNVITNPNMKTIAGYTPVAGVAGLGASISALFGGSNRGIAPGNGTSTSPQVTFTANTELVAGDLWTFQVKIKKVGTWPAGGNYYNAIRWQKVGGGELTDSYSDVYVENGSGWMQISVSAYVPRLAASPNGQVKLDFGLTGLPSVLTAAGDLGWADVCFERGGLKIYFDGSTADTATVDYGWEGPVDTSTSVAMTKNASRTDLLVLDLTDQGYGGASLKAGGIVTMERRRLTDALSIFGAANTSKLSLQDLYSMNGERPRIP